MAVVCLLFMFVYFSLPPGLQNREVKVVLPQGLVTILRNYLQIPNLNNILAQVLHQLRRFLLQLGGLKCLLVSL